MSHSRLALTLTMLLVSLGMLGAIITEIVYPPQAIYFDTSPREAKASEP